MKTHSKTETKHETAPVNPAPPVPVYSVVKTQLLQQLDGSAAGSIAELKDKLLRTQADWDNYRKRAQREKEEAIKYAAGEIFEKLLPILDNFEMGLAAAKSATDPKSIADGMSMVLSQFRTLLQQSGVETIDAAGQPFDPHRHEALGHQETAAHPEGTVVQQIRKGYKLKDRLLRPATVFVAKAPGSAQT
jgi:molecular chaperone GrpE